MKYFFILFVMLSLTACGKSPEQQAKDDYAARMKAYHERLLIESKETPEESIAKTKKMMGQ